MMTLFEDMRQAIIDGKAPVAKELTQKALSKGIKPADIFPKVIVPAMEEVRNQQEPLSAVPSKATCTTSVRTLCP
jgi:methanogenic corrinoid protein MtbC1